MRKLIFILLSFYPGLSVMAQTMEYVLHGKIGELSAPSKAYFVYESDGHFLTDSMTLNRGTFQFKGVANHSDDIAYLKIVRAGNSKRSPDTSFLQFYTDAKSIRISSKDILKNATITGGTLNRDEAELKKALEAEDRKHAFEKFIGSHPNSIVSLKALVFEDLDLSIAGPLFYKLSDSIRATKQGVDFGLRLTNLKAVEIGSPAPEFTAPDTSGRQVSLNDFKGKYVLLDFWASWCKPCRAENPYLTKALAQYKQKNFTILSVSLDQQDKEKWIEAIREDKMTWTNVSDLKNQNEAAILYGVRSIPQNFLIGPDGKIIAKNLRGDMLEKQLTTLLGQ